MAILILVYLVSCALVATLGTERRYLGYWGWFFISVLVTPIIAMMILLITQPRRPKTLDG
ncbi:MAG: hypothetical protein ACI9E4_000853 [Pseudohongiellaceae bacterium]|jgi:hypothetical protein